MNKTISILVLSALTIWSLFTFFKNLDHPNNWRLYASLGGLVLFNLLLGLVVKEVYQKK